MSVREILVAWANSEGFAAIHNGTATNEQIIEDLLKFLWNNGCIVEYEGPFLRGDITFEKFYE
jgi:hypothetical protein